MKAHDGGIKNETQYNPKKSTPNDLNNSPPLSPQHAQYNHSPQRVDYVSDSDVDLDEKLKGMRENQGPI